MSRIGITFEEVKKAIAELQGKQKNPTVDAIREVLGTGSKSTIARYLREWKAQQGLGSNDDGRLPSDLLAIVNGLWDALRNKADAQIDKYAQESDIKLIQLQQELTQSKQLETSLKQNLHSLEEQLHQRTEEVQQLKENLIAGEQEKIRLTERAGALESRCQEHKAENQRLHQLLKHVQENLEHYQAATQKLREEQSLLAEKQRNEYEQRLLLLQAQATAFSNEKSVCQAQYDHLKKMHESLVTEHKMLVIQHMEILGQHELLKTTHEKLLQNHDALTVKNCILGDELLALQRNVMELQINIKSRDEKITTLEETVAKSNDKIESLRHENQFSLQEKATLSGQLRQLQAMSSGKRTNIPETET